MPVQLSPTELNALGDWQDRVSDQRAAMPVHYSGLRYKESLRVKHLLWSFLGELRAYPSWESITPDDIAEHRALAGRLCEVQLKADAEQVWRGPAFASHRPRRFMMRWAGALVTKPKAIVDPILPAKRKKAAKSERPVGTVGVRPPLPRVRSAPPLPMPPYIGRVRASQVFKNGSRLCARFNLGRCASEQGACLEQHRCSATKLSFGVFAAARILRDCRTRGFQLRDPGH
eukprot:s519_g25.t1